ncbi:zinc finger and SCAN domain-containing protein 29-like [Trachemys scripta elegans]|uniref:zinc finger and SCAN domain-containing protein 29-like n=1 Tax=Trachemys scripta elegans TaxID=31138 RepID=UPI0015553D16|nr:zinc finger and SCAN domain-containing protein 29-like [Trachemys scripta elegans]
MAAPCDKRSPAWNNVDLLDLLSIWREEVMQSQLCFCHKNFNTYRQISQNLCQKGYDWDTLQCRVKLKALRHAYQKTREANRCSSAAPQTCHFYMELDATLSGDPTSKSPMDTSSGLELAENGPNPEDEVINQHVELDNHVEPTAGLQCGVSSQELFYTPEVSSQSQQSHSNKQEAGEEIPEASPTHWWSASAG